MLFLKPEFLICTDRIYLTSDFYEQIESNDKKMDFVRYRILTKNGNVKWVRDYGHLVHVESDVDQFYVFIVEE